MNRKILMWLQQEMPKWVDRGWLTPQGMDQIRANYGNIKVNSSPSLTRLLVVGLGLLMMGLGIFLLFAGYWYSFSPNGRFDLILVMALVVLLITGVARWKGPIDSACREWVGMLYFVVMFIAFYLVGDIYYLGCSYGVYILLLSLLSILTAYFLESSFLMGLGVITVAFWSGTEEANLIMVGSHLAWLLLGAGVPYFRHILLTESHWSQRKIFLSWAYVIAVYLTFFFTFSKEAGALIIIVLTNLAVITYCLGRLAKTTGFWTLPFRSIGLLGLLYVIYAGTFKGTWEVIATTQSINVINQLIVFGTLALTIFLSYKVFQKKYYLSTLVASSSLVIGVGAIMSKLGMNTLIITVLFNQFILFVAAMFILRGTYLKQVTLINGGITAIVVMVLARFFDPAFSFVERGISFIIVGAILLVANALYMYKKVKENQKYNKEVCQSHRKIGQLKRRQVQQVPVFAGTHETKQIANQGPHPLNGTSGNGTNGVIDANLASIKPGEPGSLAPPREMAPQATSPKVKEETSQGGKDGDRHA